MPLHEDRRLHLHRDEHHPLSAVPLVLPDVFFDLYDFVFAFTFPSWIKQQGSHQHSHSAGHASFSWKHSLTLWLWSNNHSSVGNPLASLQSLQAGSPQSAG